MNRCVVFFLCALFNCLSVHAQIIEFTIPDENEGFYDKKLAENDTIVVQAASAHLLSERTYQAYQSFKQNYMECLDERENDVQVIERKLADFDKTMDNLMAELEKQENISGEILQHTSSELSGILENLNADINNLNSIQTAIAKADKKLQEVEKKLRKERKKLFWRKIGDIALAGGLGILIGATFFGG